MSLRALYAGFHRRSVISRATGVALRTCATPPPKVPMQSRVRTLYLEFMLLVEDFPPAGTYRKLIQQRFFSQHDLDIGSKEFKRTLAKGRYALRYLQELTRIKKYRAMNKRYAWATEMSDADMVERYGTEGAKREKMGLANRDTYGFTMSPKIAADAPRQEDMADETHGMHRIMKEVDSAVEKEVKRGGSNVFSDSEQEESPHLTGH